MSDEILSITNPRLRLEILTSEDVARIHQATLEVIEQVGIRFPSQKALKIWQAHGANVDHQSQIVKAPPHLIETALKSCPPAYTLAARNPAQDLPLDGNHVYLGTDGCGVEVIDLYDGERRRSCLQDVAEIAHVADHLPEIAFHWTAVSAQDHPPQTRSLRELNAIWNNSTKHVQTESVYSTREAAAAVAMAEMIAGGSAELRKRPLLSIIQCTASPLGQDGGSLDAALIAAQAGLPVGFMTMASAASTAPATCAGTLVVGNAEVISALALLQLAHPGTPVFYAAAQTVMDLRSGGYTGGGAEDYLFGAASNVLADFYNVPLSMGAFATGAKIPDWQAGIDNSLSSLIASLVMSDMLLGAGLLYGSRIWSYEQLLMDCEIFRIVHKMMQGIRIDEDTLGLEAIRKVQPGGNFLTQKHTRQHMHELWLPQLIDRRAYGKWEKEPDWTRTTARQTARSILENHQPVALDPLLNAEIERLITTLEEE